MVATRTNRIEAIFQGARELQADTLEMLAQGRIRNAAEKAWEPDEAHHGRPHPGADRRRKPGFSIETPHGLRILESLDEVVREARLVRRY